MWHAATTNWSQFKFTCPCAVQQDGQVHNTASLQPVQADRDSNGDLIVDGQRIDALDVVSAWCKRQFAAVLVHGCRLRLAHCKLPSDMSSPEAGTVSQLQAVVEVVKLP